MDCILQWKKTHHLIAILASSRECEANQIGDNLVDSMIWRTAEYRKAMHNRICRINHISKSTSFTTFASSSLINED